MNGPQPISYEAIEAWERSTGNIIRREEKDIIMQMDNEYRAALSFVRNHQDEYNKAGDK